MNIGDVGSTALFIARKMIGLKDPARTPPKFFPPQVQDGDEQAVIYHIGSQLDLITPTQKKPMFRYKHCIQNRISNEKKIFIILFTNIFMD